MLYITEFVTVFLTGGTLRFYYATVFVLPLPLCFPDRHVQPKITKRAVDALKPKVSEYFVWDSLVTGFGVRVMPSGTKTFQVQYRKGARTRRASVGRFGVVTVEHARGLAREMLGQVASGYDPVEEIALERKAFTVADLCDRFLEVHVKASTAKDYASSIRRMIRPAIGTFKVSDVLREMPPRKTSIGISLPTHDLSCE